MKCFPEPLSSPDRSFLYFKDNFLIFNQLLQFFSAAVVAFHDSCFAPIYKFFEFHPQASSLILFNFMEGCTFLLVAFLADWSGLSHFIVCDEFRLSNPRFGKPISTDATLQQEPILKIFFGFHEFQSLISAFHCKHCIRIQLSEFLEHSPKIQECCS